MHLLMTSFTVRIAKIVCCFNLTRVSLTTCLLMENPLSKSACQCPRLIHKATFTTTIRLLYFGLPRPSLSVATRDQYSIGQLMHHGRLVFLPIPLVYQHLLDTISIRWTLNLENSSCMPREALMQPVVLLFECCLDFFS